MEEDLQIILKEYIRNVERACDILIKNINNSENLKLRNKYDFYTYRAKQRKMEFEAQGISYKLHGKGCAAFNEEMFIDWDFGYRSRWCGINPWKVSMTLKKNNSPYVEYYNGNLIKAVCEQFVEKDIMFKRDEQYYFILLGNEVFRPEFPKEYDTLLIEYFDSKWLIPRNKIIDQFVRKSIWVDSLVIGSNDKYILKFSLKGKEIFTIPYNDISYPESAVKIMSDVIIKNIVRV